MRRALLLAAALGAPALAAAQTVVPAGQVQFVEFGTTNDTTRGQYVNAAECADASKKVVLQWSTLITSGSFTGTSTYQITAANKESTATGTATAVTCLDAPGDNGLQAGNVGVPISGKAQNVTGFEQAIPPLLTAAGVTNCNPQSEVKVYVCIQALDGTNKIGYAKGTLILSAVAPGKPPSVSASPLDLTTLQVSWEQPNVDPPAYDYEIRAQSVVSRTDPTRDPRDSADHGPIVSDPFATKAKLGNLTTGVLYAVYVKSRSKSGTPSADGGPGFGIPQQVNDFWDQYRQTEGAVEQGGCATAGAGPLALAGLALLAAALRRRK